MDKNNKQIPDELAEKLTDNRICRAAIKPESGEGYDFEAVATPAINKQLRYSYQNGEYFYQVLRTGAENIKTDRLESGLPLFDNHPYDQSAMRTLGISVGYDFTEQGLVIRGKLGARADEALRSDIANKVIKTVSIEGDILEYEIIRKDSEIPTYFATLWEPTSLSFAPVPNDIGAQIEVKRALNEQIERSSKKPGTDMFNSLIDKF